MIVYLAADLLWATRIKSTADGLGLPCRPVRTLEMLEARLADGGVSALIVDLDTAEAGLALIERLHSPSASDEERAIRILAFGPHVQKELFQLARDAGADEVLARGVFDRNLPEILVNLEGRGRANPAG